MERLVWGANTIAPPVEEPKDPIQPEDPNH
jgi:hypothetical protein